MTEARIWYSSRDLEQKSLPDDCRNLIALSDEFYQEISSHPIPTDLEAFQPPTFCSGGSRSHYESVTYIQHSPRSPIVFLNNSSPFVAFWWGSHTFAMAHRCLEERPCLCQCCLCAEIRKVFLTDRNWSPRGNSESPRHGLCHSPGKGSKCSCRRARPPKHHRAQVHDARSPNRVNARSPPGMMLFFFVRGLSLHLPPKTRMARAATRAIDP
jgi:hypothetical protein